MNYLTSRSSNLATFNTVQLNVSTLTGSTIQTTATANTSSIVVSTLTTRSVTYSTLSGSSITSNTLTLSTLTVSSINSGAPGVAAYSTLNVSSMNATSTITTSTMTTTSNVGIGTASPGYILDVAGYARATSGLLAGNGTGAVSLQLFDLPAASWQITTGGYNLAINNNSASWTNRLTINQSGQVGIGVAAPSTKLHIYESPTTIIRLQTSVPDNAYIVATNDYVFLSANYTIAGGRDNVGRGSAQIVLYQPTAGGIITFNTSPSVNSDIQERMRILANGNVGIGITNHIYPLSVAGTIQAISTANDVMGLFSTTYGGYLHIGSWNASGSTSKNVVLQQLGGNVGIGITNPGYKLHVDGSIYATAGINAPSMGASYYGGGDQRGVTNYFKPASQPPGTFTVGFYGGAASGWADGISLNTYYDSTGGSQNLVLFQKSGIAMRIYQGGWQSTSAYSSYADVSFQAGSDIRLKENIQDVSDARGMIDVLRPKTFHFIKDEDKVLQIGFIAQEVRDYYPQFVTGTESETQFLSMEYGKMSPLAIAACKELYIENDALKARIDILESRLAALEQLLK